MRRAKRLSRADWSNRDVGDLWWGHVPGKDLGTEVTVLFYATDTVGEGPVWHVHPYDEIFVITEGHAIFTVGEDTIEAGPGDVLLGPADVPHKYKNLGPGRLSSIDIHCSPEWIQTNLDDPELAGAS